MSNTDLTRRGLLKSSILGAAAAGAAGFGMTATAEAAPAKKMSGTYDAIVLGAGPAGLIAAITAHDMGAKVCVMEKCDRQRHLRPGVSLRLGYASSEGTGYHRYGRRLLRNDDGHQQADG